MRGLRFATRSVPLSLLVLCLLGFGVLIPWQGFYWDDWPSVWFLHTYGPQSFGDVFAVDRPQLAWLFQFTTRLAGESTFAWQALGLFSRWLSSLTLWWALRTLWPEHSEQATWAAALFAIFPGFRQQYIAVTYTHDWLVLALFFTSYGLMIRAVRQPRRDWYWMVTSWMLAAYCVFADEYYFGLDFIRPLLMWLALEGQGLTGRQRLARSTLWSIPFTLVSAAFLYWRLVVFTSPRGQVQLLEQMAHGPGAVLVGLARTMLNDILEAGGLAWAEIFNLPRMLSLGTATSLVYLATAGISLVLTWLYLWRLSPATPRKAGYRWGMWTILTGGLALAFGGAPFWATNLPITLSFPWDRFMLAMGLGSSLLLAGLISLLPRRGLKVTLLAIILAAAVGFHIYNGTSYRREWAAQRAFFWQLAWRAPGLTPGTVVMSADLPFVYFSDNSLTAPLNWLYAPDLKTTMMPYLFYNLESRQDKKLTNLKPGVPIDMPYRKATFRGTTSRAVAVFYEPPGCVILADPAIHATLPQKPRYFSDVLPLSDPSHIQFDVELGAVPPEHIFGPTPDPDWCYYYEKADLARQRGQWEVVTALAGKAFALGTRLYEVNAPELVPYIEGYAQTQQWDQAVQLTRQANQLTGRMNRMLCQTWTRITSRMPASPQRADALVRVQEILGCEIP